MTANISSYISGDDTKQNAINSFRRVGQNNQVITPGESQAKIAAGAGSPYVSSYETNYWNSVAQKTGMTVPQLTAWMQQNPGKITDQLTQGANAANTAGLEPDSLADKVLGGVSLAMSVGALTAGVGAGIGAAAGGAIGSGAGAFGSGAAAVGGGALAGAGGAVLGNLVTKGTAGLGKAALVGGLSGGLTQGVSQLGGVNGLSNDLSNATGLPAPLASGVVKGAIGAGTSALGAKLSGGNVGNAALLGGAGGFISGAVGNATGSNALGKVAGGLGTSAIGTGSGGQNSSSVSPFLGAAGGVAAGAALSQGGQGNIGNMAGTSTDTTLAGTIGNSLPGLIGAGIGTAGSLAASNARVGADQSAITTQQGTLGNINNIWATQQGLGQGADTSLGSALGTNGQPANYSGFENMPGYQFAQQQGTQAIQRQAAAMGNAYTPNTAAAVGQYVTGTAMQDYNTYISQLMGAAGLGTTANQGLQAGNTSYGNNVSSLQVDQGYAKAGGISGVTSAAGGLFSPNGAGTSLIGAAGRYLNGGAGGGGGTPSVGGGTPGFGSSNGGFSTNGDVSGGVDPSTGVPYDISNSTPSYDSSGVIDTSGGAVDTNNWLSDGGSNFLGGP